MKKNRIVWSKNVVQFEKADAFCLRDISMFIIKSDITT